MLWNLLTAAPSVLLNPSSLQSPKSAASGVFSFGTLQKPRAYRGVRSCSSSDSDSSELSFPELELDDEEASYRTTKGNGRMQFAFGFTLIELKQCSINVQLMFN